MLYGTEISDILLDEPPVAEIKEQSETACGALAYYILEPESMDVRESNIVSSVPGLMCGDCEWRLLCPGYEALEEMILSLLGNRKQ